MHTLIGLAFLVVVAVSPVHATSYTLLDGGAMSGFFDLTPTAMGDRLLSFAFAGTTHHWTAADTNYFNAIDRNFISTNANNLTLTFHFCFDDCRGIQGTIPIQNAYTANVFDNVRSYRPASGTGFFTLTSAQPSASVPIPATVWPFAIGVLGLLGYHRYVVRS